MSRSVGLRPTVVRQVIGAISDGTGRSPDEVVLFAAAAATVAVSVAVWRGIAWAVDVVTDMDLWPAPSGRARG